MKKQNQIKLDFVSDLKFTDFSILVFSYIRKMLNINEDDFFKIELSLREVINNAIIHGNKSQLQRRVFMKILWSKKLIRIFIKDQNPDKVNFDAINKKLENNDLLAFNGRGILIMKSYMDKVKFNPTDFGTEIEMEKRL